MLDELMTARKAPPIASMLDSLGLSLVPKEGGQDNDGWLGSAIFGQPRNACLPPTGTARPAGQPAATRTALGKRGSTALGPSQQKRTC